jgi:hypothetical protein
LGHVGVDQGDAVPSGEATPQQLDGDRRFSGVDASEQEHDAGPRQHPLVKRLQL